jgi:hypothetical protein
MNKRSGNGSGVLIWIVGIGLLIFTAARSLHLVTSTLPADAQVLGFAALAGLDGGLLAWYFFAAHGARGPQRTIAVLMIAVDFFGVAAGTIGDTMLIAGGSGAASMVSTIALWLVPAVILSNVGSVIAVHLLDPEQKLRDARRSLEDELQWQLAESIQANAGQVAAGAVPEAVAHHQREMIAAFLSSTTPARSSNGKAQPMISLNSDGQPAAIEAAQPARSKSKSKR